MTISPEVSTIDIGRGQQMASQRDKKRWQSGRRLELLRWAVGLLETGDAGSETLVSMGKRARVSGGAWSNYERGGYRRMSRDKAEELCKNLAKYNLSLDWIFTGDGFDKLHPKLRRAILKVEKNPPPARGRPRGS